MSIVWTEAAPCSTRSRATVAPTLPQPCTSSDFPFTSPPSVASTPPKTPYAVAVFGQHAEFPIAARTKGERSARYAMSSTVVFMSHPVYIAPPCSASMSPTSSSSTCLSAALHVLGSSSAAQTSLAPAKPVLNTSCFTPIPIPSRCASSIAASLVLYRHSLNPPLPGVRCVSGSPAPRCSFPRLPGSVRVTMVGDGPAAVWVRCSPRASACRQHADGGAMAFGAITDRQHVAFVAARDVSVIVPRSRDQTLVAEGAPAPPHGGRPPPS